MKLTKLLIIGTIGLAVSAIAVYASQVAKMTKQLYYTFKGVKLKQATLHQLDTIATPSISTGAYGYPHKQAAKIAIQTITKYLKNHSKPTHVKLVIPSKETVKIYLEEFTQLQLRLEDRSGPQDQD